MASLRDRAELATQRRAEIQAAVGQEAARPRLVAFVKASYQRLDASGHWKS